MPSLDGRRRGNFHVHTRVHVPRRLDDGQRELLAQLDETLGADPYHHDEHGGFFSRLKNAFR
jgi:DnaJ-class molecular chaperone